MSKARMLAAVTCVLLGLVPATALLAAGEKTSITIDGSTTVGPIAKALKDLYEQKDPNVNVTVSESGSGNGIKSLLRGTCDVATASRFMKSSEFRAAAEQDVQPVAHVVAIDGIALVVHPANPVKNLKIEQVRDIYAGRIKNWSEVGGPNASIVVISRDSNSGTFESFQKLVMKKERIGQNAEYVGSNGQMRARVQSTAPAIGYVGLGFIDRTVKPLSINGVYPEKDTIVTGEYSVARPLYMFTNGYPDMGSPVHRFVTLHLTKEGQRRIEAIGFVPVTQYATE